MNHTLLNKSEHVVLRILIWVLFAFVAIEVVELIYAFGYSALNVTEDERLLFNMSEIGALLVILFNILIALELINTIQVFEARREIRILSILEVGLTVIGRKLVAMKFSETEPMALIGMAALILALSVGFYLIRGGANFTKGDKITP
jgi:uncharacterized membrane protein (DUF373 family)